MNRVESGPVQVNVELPRYDRSVPPEPFFAQVHLAAWRTGWSKEDSAAQLALALDGPALQVLLVLTPAEQKDYDILTGALEQQFEVRQRAEQRREQLVGKRRKEEENLGALATDVRRGYPQCVAAAEEELSLHAFLEAQLPEKRRQHINLSSPRTLPQALAEAERVESVFLTAQAAAPFYHPPVRVRQAEHADVDDSDGICHVGDLMHQESRGGQGAAPEQAKVLFDGTHITVVGRWGMWPVIVPPLHRCPASLWFRKTRREQSVEGQPLPPQSTPLHGKFSLGGHTQRLFVYCVLNRHSRRALIDTGSTIPIVRPGIQAETEGSMPTGWSATTMQMRMVTGERVAL